LEKISIYYDVQLEKRLNVINKIVKFWFEDEIANSFSLSATTSIARFVSGCNLSC